MMKQALAGLALFALSAVAPAQATSKPAFEVASIHALPPHTVMPPSNESPWGKFPTNRFYVHGIPLKLLMNLAYQVDGTYIVGGPDWLDDQLYEIDAKVEGDQQLTYEQIKPLLQNLLEQRFHLATHRETKPVSGYTLIVDKSGPKLTGSKDDKSKSRGQIMSNRIDGWGIGTNVLASLLAHSVGQPVVDKTGLTGTYDVKLNFAPASDSSSTLPSIFTAVEEQLGLKLVPQKVPVETLVIDQVDRTPTEN